MDYKSDIRNEAISFLKDFDDDFKEAIVDNKDFDCNEIESLDSNFHESIVDRSYTPEDALFILSHTENEETDSGIWEGQDWKEQISAKAAYSFGNDVWFEAEKIYNEIRERFNEVKGVFINDKDTIDSIWSEYFNKFTPTEIKRDSPEELQYLKKWIELADKAGTWGSYPLGHSYIDSRCGSGYGMPEIKDFVDHDNLAPWVVPYHVNKSRQDVKDRIAQLEAPHGITIIQLSRNTISELDKLKKSDESYDELLNRLTRIYHGIKSYNEERNLCH